MTAIDTWIAQLQQYTESVQPQPILSQISVVIAALNFINTNLGPIEIPEAPNTFFAGPTAGPPALPTFRALFDTDFPSTLNISIATLALGSAAIGTDTLAVSAIVKPVSDVDTWGIEFNSTLAIPGVVTPDVITAGLRNTYVTNGVGDNLTGNMDNLSFYTTGKFIGSGTLLRLKGIESDVALSASAPGTVVNDARAYYTNSGITNANGTINTLRFFSGDVVTNLGTIGLLIDFYSSDLTAIPGITTKYSLRNDDANKQILSAGPVSFNGGLTMGNNTSIHITGTGQFYGNTNTAGTPLFSFNADLTTGFYADAAATIRMSIGATNKWNWNANQQFSGTTTGAQINSGAAGTGPIFVPNRSDTKAGLGANSAGNCSLYSDVGGAQTEGIRLDTAGLTTTFNGILNSAGSITLTGAGQFSAPSGARNATPPYTFSVDLTSGFYTDSAATLRMSIAGANVWNWNANQQFANSASGAQINTAAAGTGPIFVPNRSDTKAGLGANAAGNCSLYSDVATVLTEGLRVDGSGNTTIFGALITTQAAAVAQSNVNFTNGSGAGAGTLTNAPAAGNPTKWIGINDNGTLRHFPCW